MKLFLQSAITVVFLFILLIDGYGQTWQRNNEAQIDSLVNARLTTVAPGGVVLVANGSRKLYLKAFGTTNLKTKTPMQTDMVFRIGSMTKQFTAIAILQLVEQGKINLTDSIQAYVKDFPQKAYPVTIENLISQTSGIIDFQAIQHPNANKVHENYTPLQAIDYFKDEPLLFKPGSKFEYSNSNFELLGYIIEKVTGQPYGDYMEQHILKQADLLHTYYIRADKQIPTMASGYSRFDHKHWENAELQNPTILYATGGLAANADDILQWHIALNEGKLISKKMLAKAYAPYTLNDSTKSEYGYGWFARDIDGVMSIEHSGSTDGYQTDEIYLPQQDLLIVALFNGFENDMDWQVLTNDISRLAMGQSLRNDFSVADESLKKLTGTYAISTDHKMIVTFKNHNLYIEATNALDRLPKVTLHAKSATQFYINEALIKFEFTWEETTQSYKMLGYNANGKKSEWKKVKD
jgi:CubicO group peptidase (beta-lactamase class C family)